MSWEVWRLSCSVSYGRFHNLIISLSPIDAIRDHRIVPPRSLWIEWWSRLTTVSFHPLIKPNQPKFVFGDAPSPSPSATSPVNMKGEKSTKNRHIIEAVVPTVVIVLGLTLLIVFLVLRKRRRKYQEREYEFEQQMKAASRIEAFTHVGRSQRRRSRELSFHLGV